MIRWEVDGYEVRFTTRVGGVSEGPYASLNLGRKSGDEVERVDENRRIVCDAIGADLEKLALNYQVHSARVLHAAPAMRGEHADGLWTDEPGLPILAMSADCLPIVLARAGASEPAVAVLHAGWRGLLEGIAAAGAQALGGAHADGRDRPGHRPVLLRGGGGGGGAVPRAVRRRRRARAPPRPLDERRACAPRAGVEHVDRFDRCTACEPETFFSHRRDDGRTGRQGVIAYVAE